MENYDYQLTQYFQQFPIEPLGGKKRLRVDENLANRSVADVKQEMAPSKFRKGAGRVDHIPTKFGTPLSDEPTRIDWTVNRMAKDLLKSSETYQFIKGKFEKKGLENHRVAKFGNTEVRLTKADLREVVKTALNHSNKQTHEPFSFKCGNYHWLTYTLPDSKTVRLVLWSGSADPGKDHPNYLGGGGFGVVQRVWDVASGQELALKAARSPEGSVGGSKDVHFEGQQLTEFHGKGTKPKGLQLKPEILLSHQLEVLDQKDAMVIGYIGTVYDGDLTKLPLEKLSKLQVLTAFREVLEGAKYLRDLGYSHGDIKAPNIFYKSTVQGTKFYLGDIGDCKSDEYWSKKAPRKLSAFTPDHMAYDDYCAHIKMAWKAHGGKPVSIQEKAEWLEARDVFALGVTFVRLCGCAPFPKKEYVNKSAIIQFLDASAGLSKEARNAVVTRFGEEAVAWVERMMCSDYKQRPSIAEAVAALDRVISAANGAQSQEPIWQDEMMTEVEPTVVQPEASTVLQPEISDSLFNKTTQVQESMTIDE